MQKEDGAKLLLNLDLFRVLQLAIYTRFINIMYHRSEQVFQFNSAYSIEIDALLKYTCLIITKH